MVTDRKALVSPSKPRTSARGHVVIVDHWTQAFLSFAGLMIVAGGTVAAVNSAAPFGHGSWLVAYLVLVGGVSQIVLSIGQLALDASRLNPAFPPAQLVLWNLGALAVAAGVLADVSLLVTAGSIALLAALVLFATGAVGMRRKVRARSVLYLAIVIGLAVSVGVGSAIADAAPGAWL